MTVHLISVGLSVLDALGKPRREARTEHWTLLIASMTARA